MEWRRLGAVPALAVAVLALTALVWVQRPDVEEKRSRMNAVAVSERFIEAHNTRDHETARSLIADAAEISMNPAFSVDELEMEMAWLEATGWVMTTDGCTAAHRPSVSAEGTVHVVCSLAHENAWSRVMGQQPDQTGFLTLDVVSGRIETALLSSAPMSFSNDSVRTFEDWLAEAHPDEMKVMYLYEDLPALSSESIELWSRYTDEFVEALRG
ncbi:MAG: hypothetical protein PVF87_02660 [Acidimicrobiia bacterium]